MLSVKVEEVGPAMIPVSDLKPGDMGVDADGRVYYRVDSAAVCLNDPREWYSGLGTPHPVHPHVCRLPAGSRVTLTVGG